MPPLLRPVGPNTIAARAEDFCISYNDVDVGIYGSDTTAIVIGDQMDHFYILNGDHQKAYRDLIASGAGLDGCLSYFRQNIAQINMRSERPPSEPAAETSSKLEADPLDAGPAGP